MRLVVSDTGPVLHLIETRALHLLEQTGEVVVPPRHGVDEAVIAEAMAEIKER